MLRIRETICEKKFSTDHESGTLTWSSSVDLIKHLGNIDRMYKTEDFFFLYRLGCRSIVFRCVSLMLSIEFAHLVSRIHKYV